MNENPKPNPGMVRKLVRLKYGTLNSVEGRIVFILPSFDCEFPNDDTGVLVCGEGVNLNTFKDKFPVVPLAVQFNKVTITAGECLVGIE